MYEHVFEDTVYDFKQKRHIKNDYKKVHRYDLYAKLIFAVKYFNVANGNIEFMCIDEGQDLAFNEYQLLFELNQKHTILNIFGDTNQLIDKERGIADWDYIKSVFDAHIFQLNENYRNTNQITRFCNRSFGMQVLQTGVDGPSIREIPRKDLEEEIIKANNDFERLALLVPRKIRKEKYLDYDVFPTYVNEKVGEKIGKGLLAVMYVDEVKGIEFDKVFVVGNQMKQNEKYIAYTRALSELIIVVDNELKEIKSSKKEKKVLKELRLKAFAGSGLKEGIYREEEYTKEQIMGAFDNIFSNQSRKDTSYKFAFLQSILDSLDMVYDEKKLYFDQLFLRFAELYWPLVNYYKIRQKVGDKESYIEQYIKEFTSYYDLEKVNCDLKGMKEIFLNIVTKKCKTNVVGALYGDTCGIFYAFNKKEEWIKINPRVYEFLLKNRSAIRKKNYQAWAEFMDRISDQNVKERALKLEPNASEENVYQYLLIKHQKTY